MIPPPPPNIGASTAEFVNAAWSYAIYILWPMISPLVTMILGIGLAAWLILRLLYLYRRYFVAGAFDQHTDDRDYDLDTMMRSGKEDDDD